MTSAQIEQNFELPGDIATLHQVNSPPVKRALWKRLIITIPAIVFVILLVTLIILSQKNRQPSSTQVPAASASPTLIPSQPILDQLSTSSKTLLNLDIEQPSLAPPILDSDIQFKPNR